MHHFIQSFEQLKQYAPPENSFIITDEHLEMLYHDEMKPWKSIVIPPGEKSKDWEVIDNIIVELLALNADRDATIIGIGGGVVTDIAGFVAAIYKRGVDCVLMPTSILAMVDASIGGKNGINIRSYKNMIGTIRQPKHILYLTQILETLPEEEWHFGFAEIIKHALIADKELWKELSVSNVDFYRKNKEALRRLIEQNMGIKFSIVVQDEREAGIRKILNFGHTLAHAIEKESEIPHGNAVAIGMVFASGISDQKFGLNTQPKVIEILQQYNLPTSISADPYSLFISLSKDKKRFEQHIDFVLLSEIGKATIFPIPLEELKNFLVAFTKK